jgi:hypothetical protein
VIIVKLTRTHSFIGSLKAGFLPIGTVISSSSQYLKAYGGINSFCKLASFRILANHPKRWGYLSSILNNSL